jgi:hypothetical protein
MSETSPILVSEWILLARNWCVPSSLDIFEILATQSEASEVTQRFLQGDNSKLRKKKDCACLEFDNGDFKSSKKFRELMKQAKVIFKFLGTKTTLQTRNV